ncbi:MAG: folate-binding protein [Hydrogenophaga sp.]|uniref:CAF17-like 4Fe-4S cluster assembly/insertion protein YgfZ n=1 Tax=Hydrogenophaga sp. TaxID=1904254 RepID=UPI002725B6F5|nr:folate-binding protein [Hydrogenophaga sp.]MDO9134619.1 folate-binding protein [Hydrogenophaga sp.]MDO9503819.1 folate-binding protein [Hydrogenophaga sp.]MDP3203514.1 folate-binding protein [Hydrogenophaga sp.]MDP3626960.1 folate-binding protein [Hydrogenophaga sp.]
MTPLPSTADTPVDHGVARLTHLGVIQVDGEEAAKFLHGQLTHDFALLGLSEARLAAFCSAKGRMQASFVGFKRSHDQILLVCSRDLLPATLKRLSMFVLRAKAKLSDASDAFAILGLAGSAVPAALPAAPWSQLREGDASVVRLYPADGTVRALWVAPADTPAPAGDLMTEDLWNWLDVKSAVATLSQPVFEAFVPQMLNYESVGGVNFKKGCYPGQEVVARSQFRGTLKRRAYVVHSEAPLTVGQEVFHSSDAEQPCGTVVQAAAHPAGGFDAIVSMQTSAAADGSLHAGSASGAVLTLQPLPYPLLDDI